jgi:hypothetical protein
MRFVLLCALAACSKGSASGSVDAPPKHDAPVDPDAVTPYRHTIQIDGVDDFLTAEQFPTTSAGYGARVAWDEQQIYIGYSGTDFDPATADAATKWLFVYVDVDPGAANGATVNETYRTQSATFPAGFRADFYVRWRCDATLLSLKTFSGGTWMEGTPPQAQRSGTFLELAIPRSVIVPGDHVSLVAWMINEKDLAESSFAGLYTGNFADGYASNLALTKFLKIDFTSPRDPNDPANQGP